ncbi:MAG: rhodanese-like domain-containing protein [Methanothrix sp.]|nr:rhodanese-like domain-containing protein [Methanothrix sp.]
MQVIAMVISKSFLCSVALACLLIQACAVDESPAANTYSDPALNELKKQVLEDKTTVSGSYKGQPWATSPLNESNQKAVSVTSAPVQISAATQGTSSNYLTVADSFLKGSKTKGFYIISVPDFVNSSKADPSWVIVDVRATDQYAQGHAQGALSMPLENLVSQLGMIPAGKKVAVYGDLDIDAAYAVETLRIFADRDAYVLSGGISALQIAGFTTIT